MSVKTDTVINIGDLGMKVTDEQVHHIYNELAEADKTSTDNLAAAEEETESSNYTSEDNNEIDCNEEIPGVNVTPVNVADLIEESQNDIKSVLDPYDFDEATTTQLLKVIDEYKAGKKDTLYLRLPSKLQEMVNGIILTETHGNVNRKELSSYRNNVAKMLIDDFINDAKISAAMDDFNEELNATITEMNAEYDTMLLGAIDNVFNKIEEIRAEDPDHAAKIESVKNAFERSTTFESQLCFAQHTSPKKFDKLLTRFKDDVYYFNKKVNNNTFGVKISDIEELVPIIKLALPQYTEEDIKKFIICICRTIENVDTIAGISYECRMVSSIYKYKYINIDAAGEELFEKISKVIDAILS